MICICIELKKWIKNNYMYCFKVKYTQETGTVNGWLFKIMTCIHFEFNRKMDKKIIKCIASKPSIHKKLVLPFWSMYKHHISLNYAKCCIVVIILIQCHFIQPLYNRKLIKKLFLPYNAPSQ